MNTTGNNKVKGFAAGIIAAVCYGTNPLGTLRLYADGYNSSTVLTYRYGLAIVLFALVMLVRRERFAIKWGHAIRFAFLGCFFGLSSTTLYVSFHYMEAGIASTLLFVYPIMTAALMTAFFHERVTWRTSLAILLAVCGVAMLYQGDGGGKLSTAGFALVMASSLLYAIYIISVNQWHTTMSNVKFTFWILFFCFLTILGFSLFTGETIMLLQTPMQWACGVQLALLPTVLSLFFMTISINLIGSTPSAIMGALEPVTAVCIGVLVYGESFSLRLAFGILLILAGVILIILKKSNADDANDRKQENEEARGM